MTSLGKNVGRGAYRLLGEMGLRGWWERIHRHVGETQRAKVKCGQV